MSSLNLNPSGPSKRPAIFVTKFCAIPALTSCPSSTPPDLLAATISSKIFPDLWSLPSSFNNLLGT